jgi:putative phosphoribosyl transferase
MLVPLRLEAPLVLALPRGGVPVAAEVAAALRAPLDVLLVRKIGAPDQPEYGIGAVVDGTPPRTVLNEATAADVGASPAYIEAEAARQREEIARRRLLYREGRAPEAVGGRTIVLVDDGIATGATVRAALLALRDAGAARIVLAVPVAAHGILRSLRGLADHIVCLASPEPFRAVGLHYASFEQTSDAEVVRLLAAARSPEEGSEQVPRAP